MSYGTIQDVRPAAGRARVHFDPQLPPPSEVSEQEEHDGESEARRESMWKRVGEGLKGFYERNFGLFLVFLAQTCGSIVRLRLSQCNHSIFFVSV